MRELHHNQTYTKANAHVRHAGELLQRGQNRQTLDVQLHGLREIAFLQQVFDVLFDAKNGVDFVEHGDHLHVVLAALDTRDDLKNRMHQILVERLEHATTVLAQDVGHGEIQLDVLNVLHALH